MILTLALKQALTRQSLDALARKFVRQWKPKAPDKRRTARSFAAEIRKLAKGQAAWFHNRPEAAKLLAKILGSTPEALGLVRVLFEIQVFQPFDPGRAADWHTYVTRPTLEEAEDLAWSMLCQHGGQWRVRQGNRTIASGSGYRSGETPYSHDRTAVWSRVVHKAAAKKRKAS
jgi:hypothetical protein